MKQVKQVQKQFNFLTTLLAGAFIIVVISFFMSFKRLAVQKPAVNANPQTITSANDLDKASTELDSENLDQMDSDLNQVSTDSASF